MVGMVIRQKLKKRGKIRRARLQHQIEIEKFHMNDLKAVWDNAGATTS